MAEEGPAKETPPTSQAQEQVREGGAGVVEYIFRDIGMKLVKAWQGTFAKYIGEGVQVWTNNL